MATNPAMTALDTREAITKTIGHLRDELARTERGIDQLDAALSSQGIAMRAQLVHRTHSKRTPAIQNDAGAATCARLSTSHSSTTQRVPAL